jgi:two-component system, cell cycle response regulator
MKILAVDDDPIARKIIESSLKKWGYEPLVVSSCEEALSAHAGGGYSFVIADWIMPGQIQGVDLVTLIRSSDNKLKDEYTYIILLTSKCNKEDLFEGINAGADDFVSKPFDPTELKTRVQLGIRILNLRETNLSLKNQLTCSDMHRHLDSLTGVYSRTAFTQKLHNELLRNSSNKSLVGLVGISIPIYNEIIIREGFKTADNMLLEISKNLRNICASGDFTGRLGDCQFGIVTRAQKRNEIKAFIKLCRDSINSYKYYLRKENCIDTIPLRIRPMLSHSIARTGDETDAYKLMHDVYVKISQPCIERLHPNNLAIALNK